MKHFKKLASVALALVLALAMAVPAFAANDYTITINGTNSNHTYQAYQVFSGTLAEKGGKKYLAEIQWGDGVDGPALLEAFKSTHSEFTGTTAADVAEWLEDNNNDENAKAFATLVSGNLTTVKTEVKSSDTTCIVNVGAPGYYFIKDMDDSLGAGEAYSRYMLQVVGPATVTAKGDAPSSSKEIEDSTKKDPDYDILDIGSTVTFKLKATLPSKFDEFSTYTLVFHDTMSAGLTFEKITSVTVAGQAVTDYTTDNKGCVNYTNHNLHVSFDNIKNVSGATAGAEVVVTYTATLNEKAVIGNPGNTNEMYIEYSNDPNNTDGTGSTPPDKVVVFTFEIDATKKDGGDQTALAGVKFKLVNSEDKYAVVTNGKFVEWTDDETKGTELVSAADGQIKITGLADGTYTLKETEALPGYNPKDYTLVIQSTVSKDNGTIQVATLTLKVDEDVAANQDAGSGSVKTDIFNNRGALLPETGGIGTTIFYIAGGVLLVGAVVLLIAKRRTSGVDDE